MGNEINKIISDFHVDSYFLKVGIELEFYLTKNHIQINDQKLVESFINNLLKEVKNNNLDISDIQKEQGLGQLEIKTFALIDLNKLCHDIELVKVISKDLASTKYGLEVNFNPTPFPSDCSNALQINLTILDQNNNNLFDRDGESESKILLNSIAGILKNLPKNISNFTNLENNLRFDFNRNKELFLNKKYTSPVNLSWGYDNRSCAIRIVGKENNRRLEFRIPDSDSDLKQSIIHFLRMIKDGIDNDLKPIEAIYGNAFDDQYKGLLVKLRDIL